MSKLEKRSWNALTPGSVPAGARISAGKSGNVAMSLPISAVVRVNWSPVSCMPSPESPANRITTWSSSWTWRSGAPCPGPAVVEDPVISLLRGAE